MRKDITNYGADITNYENRDYNREYVNPVWP